MTTLITSDKFNTYKAEGFNFIPLVKSFDVGHETPLSIYQKLANLPFSYLLESVEGGERFGRYSIIGLPSKKRIVIRDDVIEVIDQNKVIKKEDTQNPLDFIQNYLSQFKVPHDIELPRFAGGLAGYFGYETIQYIEARIKHKNRVTNSWDGRGVGYWLLVTGYWFTSLQLSVFVLVLGRKKNLFLSPNV